MTGVMIVLLPPFLMLPIMPMMMLVFLPIALVLLPFMIGALFSKAQANRTTAQLIRVQRLPPWGAMSAV